MNMNINMQLLKNERLWILKKARKSISSNLEGEKERGKGIAIFKKKKNIKVLTTAKEQ